MPKKRIQPPQTQPSHSLMNLASTETATNNQQAFSYAMPNATKSSYQMELDHGQQPLAMESSTTGQSYNNHTAPSTLPSLSSLPFSNQYPSFKKEESTEQQPAPIPVLNPTPLHSSYPVFSNSPPVRSMSPSIQQQQPSIAYHAAHRFAPIYSATSYNQNSSNANSNAASNGASVTTNVYTVPPYYAPPPPFYYPRMPYAIHEAAPPPMMLFSSSNSAPSGSPMLSSTSSTSPEKSTNVGSNTTNTNNGIVKPPHPNSKRKKKLSKEEILKYIQYPQPDAARMLNVSVSTLKRRFYELGLGRWPYPTTHLPSQSTNGLPRSGTSSGNNSNRSSGRFEAITMEDEGNSQAAMESDHSSNTSAEDEDVNMGSADNIKETIANLNPGTTEAHQNLSGIVLSSSASPRETLLNRDPVKVLPNQLPLFIHSNIIAATQQNQTNDATTTDNILQVIQHQKGGNPDATKNKLIQSEILKKKFGDIVQLKTDSEDKPKSSIFMSEHLKEFSQAEAATPRTKVSINWLANDKHGVTTPEAKMVNRETIEALKNSF